MRSVNKVTLLGALGRNPETRSTKGGTAVATLSVATSRSWKDKQTDEWKEETDWHRVILFGRRAEVVDQYLKKGSKVYLEGRLQTRKYPDKSTGEERFITEIIADEVIMLDGKNSGRSEGGESGSQKFMREEGQRQQARREEVEDEFGDSIPF